MSPQADTIAEVNTLGLEGLVAARMGSATTLTAIQNGQTPIGGTTASQRLSSYDLALALSALGCFVLPSRSKSEHIPDWPRKASRDPAQLAAWFGPGCPYEHWRISIFTGRFGSDASLLVVDVDEHKDGFASLTKLESVHDFPKTRTHSTPRGGQHKIYTTSFPGVTSDADVLGPGLDIRSAGGLIYFGDGYAVEIDAPLAEAPAWLVKRCARATVSTPATRDGDVIDPDQERAWRNAEDLLQGWPPIVEGRRNAELHKFVCAVREHAATDAATTLAIGLAFCDACDPPYPHEEGRKTILSAIKSAKNPAGSKSDVLEVRHAVAKQEFESEGPAGTTTETRTCPAWLEELKQRYFVADDDGNVRVFCLTESPGPTDPLWKSFSFDDFKKRYQHQVKPIYNAKASKVLPTDMGTAFLNHPDRPEFMGGLVFAPRGDHRPNQKNTWRGWTVADRAGAHPLMTAHLLKVICAGNADHFRYLMGALATMYQRQDEPWQIILVIRGPQGCGKGFGFTDQLRTHFGAHAAQLLQGAHLTGRFNAHLRDKVLIVANEAFFAGDRQHHAFLKGLATERTIYYEEKNRMPVQCKNVGHLIITTNEDWAVPADADDRRMFVLDAAGTFVRDHAYFAALDRELQHGGREALLHTFLTYDLTGFNILNVPKTKALAEQKDLNLRGPYQWIRDVLSTGRLGLRTFSETSRLSVSKQEVMAAYARDHHHEKYSVNSPALSKALVKVFPRALSQRRPYRKDDAGQMVRGEWEWDFAPLGELRADFERYYGQMVQWDPEDQPDPFED